GGGEGDEAVLGVRLGPLGRGRGGGVGTRAHRQERQQRTKNHTAHRGSTVGKGASALGRFEDRDAAEAEGSLISVLARRFLRSLARTCRTRGGAGAGEGCAIS